MDYELEVHRAVCAEVRRVMESRQVKQCQLADLLGVDTSTMSRMLKLNDDPKSDRRRLRPWKASEVYAFADLYGVPIDRFFPK